MLLLGILAFYVYDAALLLYADEVVFMRKARRWSAAIGDGAIVGGRYLAFPALLSPGSPVFRAAWDADLGGEVRPTTATVLGVLRPLRWQAWLLALALFAVVPLALALHFPPTWLLGVLAVIYLPTALAMLHIARRREILGLTRREVAAIAFDVLACPPFALNLVRRVSLRCGLADAAPVFADAVLDAASRARLQQSLDARRALLAGDPEPSAKHQDGSGGAA